MSVIWTKCSKKSEVGAIKNKRTVGTDYEQKAAQHLETLGYHILEKNFRCRLGEIDLIAMDGSYLVFIEVKYRSNRKKGEPQEAVGYKKQAKICRTASYYCVSRKVPQEQACRFDVAAYVPEKWTIIQNAFDYVR